MRQLAVLLMLCSSIRIVTAQSKFSPELENVESAGAIDVIVQYRQNPTDVQHQRVLSRGGELRRELSVIHAAHYSIPARELDALASDPDVEYISPDRAVTATTDKKVYIGNPDYGWRTVGADLASSVFGLDGSGIGIALIDSGVDSIPDLHDALGRDRVVYRASFLPNGTAMDLYGHGDHVAGILAGNGAESSGSSSTYLVRGIAPNAHIISLKVLGTNGSGTDSGVIAAIQQAIALKAQYNIRVINLSLGRPVTVSYLRDPLCQALQQAWQAGIVVVVAAGNNGRDNSHGTYGYGTITAPGNSPFVITVGAMNTNGTLSATDDKIATYSSKGPTSIDHIAKPDLVAPGNRIFSLSEGTSWFAKSYPGNDVSKTDIFGTNAVAPSGYYVMSGTSMAAPMVSGAAALMIQKDPSLTPDQVKARLMESATRFAPGFSTATDPVTGVTYTDEYDLFTVGAGYLNIPAALADTDLLSGPALSPTATYSAAAQSVSLAPTGTGAAWGTPTIWGNTSIYEIWGGSAFVNGTIAIWGTGSVFGTIAIWGTGTPQALQAIWGTIAIWGTGLDATEPASLAVQGDN
jgi:serine protease AprX